MTYILGYSGSGVTCEYCGTKSHTAYKGACPSCPPGAMAAKLKAKRKEQYERLKAEFEVEP